MPLSTTFYGSARRYDRGQLLIFFTTEVPARFPICFGQPRGFLDSIVVLMVLPRLKERTDMVNAACDLGVEPQVQNAQRDHVAAFDTSHYCWLLLWPLPIRFWRLCRDLLCNRKWLYNLFVEIYHARQGISSVSMPCPPLSFFSVLWSSVITLLPVKRRKQHENGSFLTGIVLSFWSSGELATRSMNTKNSDKLVIYKLGRLYRSRIANGITKSIEIQEQYDTFWFQRSHVHQDQASGETITILWFLVNTYC